MITVYRILALVSGAITLLLGMLSFMAGLAQTKPEHVSTVNIIAGVLFYIVPSLLVAIGAYVFLVKQSSPAFLLIGVVLKVSFSSIFMLAECSMCLWWEHALNSIPALTALATAIFSLAAPKSTSTSNS